MSIGADILSVNALNAAYGESKVLFDVNLRVRPREIVACVGRNGAGKTTLLRSIAGFLKPTSGTIVSNTKSLVGQAAFVIAQMNQIRSADKKSFPVGGAENLGPTTPAKTDWTPVTNFFPNSRY
jgi:branched-chain amino acid transport system ATP-binding protein